MTPGRATASSRVRLGELLVKAGVITEAQLRSALHEQKQWGGRLGEILVRMKFLSEDLFVRALSRQLSLERADMGADIRPEVLARIPAELAEEYEVVPLSVVEEGRALALATADPVNGTVLEHLRTVVGLRIVPYVAGPTAIRTAIARLYKPAIAAGPFEPVSPGEAAGAPIPRLATVPELRPIGLTPSASAPLGVLVPAGGGPGQGVLQTPLASPAGTDPSQKREAAALKALVELLVQKGVITMDEYLARLKR